MGEIEVRGADALALVQSVTSNNAAKLADGHAQYSGLLNDRGGFVDDLLVHRISESHYLLCVNASNQDGDFEYIRARNRFGAAAEIENAGERYSQLALQGPKALGILAPLTTTHLDALRYYQFTFGAVNGVKCLIARTGYTGEDGFELYFAPEHSEALWDALLEAGRPAGLLPCGLGARNTLRLEAGMRLYGHELDETTTVWEADLAWICKLDKGEFVGRKALVEQKARGIERTLVGFEMSDRQIARDACGVSIGGAPVGRVTSGSPAPYLKKNIGMAYVPLDARAPGTEIEIDIRGNRAPARIVPLPFYKRAQ
jgi:aminomethyltransferase